MLFALGAAFLGGLILNVMPCVFPIISLKALGLVRHGGNPASMRAEGLAFLGGVVTTMLALAGLFLALRAGGSAIGWGFQLQSPLVIAALALVMLAAALNLAGLFEVGLAAQRIGGAVEGREGLVGAALTGALAIVVATPCTAPFMAGALGYALVQPPLIAIGIFLALALGFATPFTAVAMVPALATRIPRPGPWMDIVKRVLAFPMLGAAAWLVWVLDQQVGSGALAIVLGASIALGFGAWIYGLAQQRHMMARRARPLYLLSGTVVAGLVAAVVSQVAPTAAETAPDAPRTIATATPKGPVTWSPERLATLRKAGRPVFVNFTASWCITCQVNDKAALSTAEVRDALSRTGTTYLIADSTRYDPRIDDALAQYDRGGLPLYVVYPANGRPPVILPQLLTRAIVVAALEAAARPVAS